MEDELSLGDAWQSGLEQMYLQPVGVPGPAVGLWNLTQLDRITKANPALKGTAFVLPSAGRPFWVTAATIVGPSDHLPVAFVNSSFVQLTSTPLYVGLPNAANVSYVDTKTKAAEAVGVGGFVEPHAAGTAGVAPPPASPAGAGTGAGAGPLAFQVLKPGVVWSVSKAIAASSLFYAAAVSKILPGPAKGLNLHIPYWSPASPTQPPKTMELADGGCMDNAAVVTMIQRRVASIVAFISTETPMSPKSAWDPTKTPYTKDKQIDDAFTSYFGVNPAKYVHAARPNPLSCWALVLLRARVGRCARAAGRVLGGGGAVHVWQAEAPCYPVPGYHGLLPAR